MILNDIRRPEIKHFVFGVVGPTQGVADESFGSHSEQEVKSYGQKKISASTRRVTR